MTEDKCHMFVEYTIVAVVHMILLYYGDIILVLCRLYIYNRKLDSYTFYNIVPLL